MKTRGFEFNLNFKIVLFLFSFFNIVLFFISFCCADIEKKGQKMTPEEKIILPEPKLKGTLSLEEAISKRRSKRQFKSTPISREQLSQILWASQGITQKDSKFRTVPSAGALFPLEIFVVNPEGIFYYIAEEHCLKIIRTGDFRNNLKSAALNQNCIGQAPLSIIIAAKFTRTTIKYGERGIRYCYLEAGHCCQNILLEAVSLNLASVPLGAFADEKVDEVLQLREGLSSLYIICIGQSKD